MAGNGCGLSLGFTLSCLEIPVVLNLKGSFFALASVTTGGFSFTLLRKYKEVNMVPAMAINGLFITTSWTPFCRIT